MKIRPSFVLAVTLTAAAATGCAHVMTMMPGGHVSRPPEAEFGTGPRVSAAQRFTATL
jgi:hypothetical protein